MATEQELESAPPIAADRTDWEFHWEVDREVRLVDTDATGMVHFAAYVRMMEEAEYAFLRDRGLSVVLRDERGTLGFPRLSANIDIVQPVTHGEMIRVQVLLAQLDAKSIEYQFRLVDSVGTTRVRGEFRAACCRFPDQGPPYAILIPESVVAALADFNL